MSDFQPFDALEMPLGGLRMIEASAGTGKTFGLASLYLRLIVEKALRYPRFLRSRSRVPPPRSYAPE